MQREREGGLDSGRRRLVGARRPSVRRSMILDDCLLIPSHPRVNHNTGMSVRAAPATKPITVQSSS